MATKIKDQHGRERTLLTPREKAGKYYREMSSGLKETNDGQPKMLINRKTGEQKRVRLSDIQRSYRKGYLDARRDIAKCHAYHGDSLTSGDNK